MKKIVFTLILAVSALASWGYDFSAVAPSGQTLYYNISGSTVSVTYPGPSPYYWYGYSMPGDLVIPSSVNNGGTTYSVTSIGDHAFDGCYDLTGNLTIPNSVTSIGNSAFEGCFRLMGSLIIPNSVTSIGYAAFEGCSGLTGSLIIPNSVTTIGYHTFFQCSGLTSVSIPNSVISIGQSAFYGCYSLTGNLTIPNSVISIDRYAFEGCYGLTGDLTIPNSVTSIGYAAFCGCSGLTSVNIGNSVISIGDQAFRDCSGLTYVSIPNSVTSIGQWAFCNCSGLTSVSIPNSVTSIGSSAFSGCSGLTSVSIPNSVTYIPNSTFSNCSGLTSVTIGTSVTYIGQGAFRDCSGLTSVIIPNSVARIDHLAFYGCDSILEITALPTISPSLGTDVFTCSRSTIVNIPCGCMMNYSVDWDYFTNFVEGMVFSVSVESDDTAQGSVAVLSQPTTCEDPQAVVSATPAPGYHFHHWSDGSTSNPYTFTVVSDTLLIAYFALDSTEGIDSVQPSDYSISTSGNQVVITGTSNQRVRIFDSMGRLLSTFRTSNSSTALPVLTTGVYLVQVANHPAQKVVIR